MSDPTIPGTGTKSTVYKVTQKLPNGGIICKVFSPEGMGNAMGDLLGGVGGGATKTVEVSSLQLDTKSVNLDDFFKAGGLLFSTNDIK